MADSTVPDWMTRDFLQSSLQSREEQPITLKKHTIKIADVPDGNNYGSQIFRVNVDYIKGDTESSTNLIIKAPLAQLEEMVGEIYEKEVKFYSEFVNETYKYSKHDIVPKHYVSPNPRCVVLEDLKIPGYVMVDRHNFLDFEHCQLFIKAKAKLHALSAAIYRDSPEIITSLMKESQSFVENNKKMMKYMLNGSLLCMTAYLEDNLNNEAFKDFLGVIKEASKNDNLWNIYEEVENACLNKPFRVLIQLDPWCTNMMFKYDSLEKVKSVKLLDFQSLSFNSPLKEIITFMTMCPNMDVRKSKLNDLYNLYINTFNEHLAAFGCPERLSFEEVKAEIVTLSPLVLLYTCACVPIMLAEGAADVNEYTSGNIFNGPVRQNPVYKLYQSETFTKIFPEILDQVAKEGVFDYVKEKLMMK